MKDVKGRKLTIERGRGATYRNNRWTVYAHDFFPRHSVLAGQPRRTFVDSFEHLEDAKREFPTAKEFQGTTYMPPSLAHLPDDGDY